jgi:hypothetical protein
MGENKESESVIEAEREKTSKKQGDYANCDTGTAIANRNKLFTVLTVEHFRE